MSLSVKAGVPFGLRRAGRRGDDAVAVGVDEMRVDPVGLAGGGPAHVADADQRVLGRRAARQRVPVHGQHIGELVVALDLLELLE